MEDVYLNIDDVRKRAYEIAKSCKSSIVYSPMLLLAGVEIGGEAITDEFKFDKDNMYRTIEDIYGDDNFSEGDSITISVSAGTCFSYLASELDSDRRIKIKDFIKIVTDEYVVKEFLSRMGIYRDRLDSVLEENLDDIPKDMIDLNSIKYESNPAIGREIIIEDMEKILLKMNKPNILLLGKPGVGKTAIVEGLAYKIQQGKVNDKLKRIRIISCSSSSLVAGTKYRGQFEEKVEEICDFFKKHPNYILFIDEMHTTVNAGGAEGAINMANILKPYLARGDIKMIGCTTLKENKTITDDEAYNRRFTKIYVDENDKKETLKILEGSLSKFNKFYGINGNKKLLKDIITESEKLNGVFPDKAIDLLENVFADTLWNEENSFELKDIQRVTEILKERQNELEEVLL